MRNVVGVVALVVACGVAVYVALSRGPAGQPQPPAAAETVPTAQTAQTADDGQGQGVRGARAPAPAAVPALGIVAGTPAPAPAPPAGRDDLVAMETLRELLNTEPRRALELARQANRRAPDSPDAAERGWIIVKALAGLKRFHEARDEAATLVSKYPDSAWAMDAKRHMLVHPLDLPSREEQQRQMQQDPQRPSQ